MYASHGFSFISPADGLEKRRWNMTPPVASPPSSARGRAQAYGTSISLRSVDRTIHITFHSGSFLLEERWLHNESIRPVLTE